MNDLAWVYVYSNPDTAYLLAQEEYELAVGIGDTEEIAIAFVAQGAVFWVKGDYPVALQKYTDALQLYERIDDEDGIANVNNNMGLVYGDIGDYTKAIEHYKISLEIKERQGDKRVIAISMNNIGIIYLNQTQYSEALEYFQKALKLTEEIADTNTMASIYNNVGIIYWKEEKFEEALVAYQKSLGIRTAMGDLEGVAASNLNIGMLNTSLGNTKLAEEHLNKGLKMTKEMGLLGMEKEAYFGFNLLYEKTEDYQKAYEAYKQFAQLKDSLFNEDKSKEIGRLEAKYEMEKNIEEEKQLNEQRARILAEDEQRRNNLQYSGILIFIVLLALSLFGIKNFNMPIRVVEGLVFFSFLLFFEFTLVLLDPYIEMYSAGAPAIKLAFNAVLAGLIFPLHSFFEEKIKNRIIKS